MTGERPRWLEAMLAERGKQTPIVRATRQSAIDAMAARSEQIGCGCRRCLTPIQYCRHDMPPCPKGLR